MSTLPLNLFPLTTRVSMKLTAGIDERWLQDQIYLNPKCLGLGELHSVGKEVQQPSGGKLDMLLRDDDETMYEVEIMLGATDPSHIVRAIEYWDVERRRRPQYQHYAVLVAEHFDRRFFNVIYLLSETVPFIAIQAQLLEFEGKRLLNFTTVLDVYEDVIGPADTDDGQTYTREYWVRKNRACLETAEHLAAVVQPVLEGVRVNFTSGYVNLMVSGRGDLWLLPRQTGLPRLNINAPPHRRGEILAFLSANKIEDFEENKHVIYLRVDKAFIDNNKPFFLALATYIKSQL